MTQEEIEKAACAHTDDSGYDRRGFCDQHEITESDMAFVVDRTFIKGAQWAAEQMKEENEHMKEIIKELIPLANQGHFYLNTRETVLESMQRKKDVINKAKEALKQQ